MTLTKKNPFSATLIALPQYFFDASDPERINYFGYMASICDNETGEVVAYETGSGKEREGLDSLAKGLLSKLKEIKAAKKLYVNSFIDECFFNELFAPYINKKKMKLIVTRKELPADKAMDVFVKEYERMANKKNGEKKYSA